MEIRSFLAFDLPGDLKKTLSRIWGEMKTNPIGVRWIKIENIHLTLVFMGDVPSQHIEPIGEITAEVCREYGPFKIAFKGVGVFPYVRRPRVLWIGLDGDIQRMSDFRDTIQQKLKPFGIKQDRRPYKPHLTIGRFRKELNGKQRHLRALLSTYEGLTTPVGAINELVLFHSDLQPNGATYTRLNTWPLAGEL